MRFNDTTLMLLNVCANPATNVISEDLKQVLINCFVAGKCLQDKKPDKMDNGMVVFFQEVLEKTASLTAGKALGSAPQGIKAEVEPLWATQARFEEILTTLGGESYRDHLRHSERDFWLGMLLSGIKSNWGSKLHGLKSFEELWFLIARFHDFCYVLQNIKEIVGQTQNVILDAFRSMNFSLEINFTLGSRFMGQKYLRLLKYINPGKSASSFLTNISFLEQLDNRTHSILSSLFIIDFLRRKDLVPKLFSEKDLKRIARSVALHTDSTTQAILQPKDDFFAGLMILVDEIQEWGRPKHKKDDLIIEEIELRNLKLDFKKNPRVQSFVGKMLCSAGNHKLPKLKFDIGEQFESFWVVENTPEYKIVLRITIKTSDLFEEPGTMSKEQKKQLVVEHARDRARKVVSTLSSYGESIGLKAVQIEPDDIIRSKSEKSVLLEIPLVARNSHFPINADRNLLSIVLAFILDGFSPYSQKNVPKIVFEEKANQVIEFNIPHLRDADITGKKRNLSRLNAFKWDWGISIVSDPSYNEMKEDVFPVRKV